jgi:hypothetical protein
MAKTEKVVDLECDMSNMDITKLGRFCEIENMPEVKDLKKGMDFRKPEYRREVFLRFYETHLKYRSHPGAVYYVMPFLSKKYNWNTEQKLWFAYINGCTQNPLTSWVLFNKFPNVNDVTFEDMEKWHREHWRNLDYDTDRRYQKGHFVTMVMDYKKNLDGKTQEEFFNDLCSSSDPYENFKSVWDKVRNDFHMYGRLSTFSYLEYLKIMGVNIDCNDLFIYDKSGSKSHRNGICVVNGRDDLDWKKGTEIHTAGGHNKEIMEWCEQQGKKLLQDAIERFKNEDFFNDVNYFTLESTLCCYKSWHRHNRRYPNVYNDMFHDRIKKAETRNWLEIDGSNIDFNNFWEARKEYLPQHFRLEDNPNDPGLVSIKQNWYRTTGEVIMLENEYECFEHGLFSNNNLNDW